MKKGCLLILSVWLAVSAGYFYLFHGTFYEHLIWLPIALGFGAMIVAANLQGILLAIQQKRAAQIPLRQWQDGQYVVVSGKISPIGEAIAAPFSGAPSCFVEYEIKRGEETAGAYSGFLMTPSTIMTKLGTVRVIGFPMLAEITSTRCYDDADFQRAGEYLSKCKFQEKASNPIAAIAQLNSVMENQDGQLKADYVTKGASLHEDLESDETDASSGENSEVSAAPAMTPAQIIAYRIGQSSYLLEETLIKTGTEVTVTGTFRKAKQAIEIGSGLKNLSHTLKLGSVAQSTGKLLVKSIVMTLLFGAIFAAANVFVLNKIGLIKTSMPGVEPYHSN